MTGSCSRPPPKITVRSGKVDGRCFRRNRLNEETTIRIVMGATQRQRLSRKFRRWFSDNGVIIVLVLAIFAAAWLVANR